MELSRRLELEKMVNQYILKGLNYSDEDVPFLDLEDALVDIIDVLGSELNLGRTMKYTLSNKVTKRFEERLNLTGSRSGRLSIDSDIDSVDFLENKQTNLDEKTLPMFKETYLNIHFKLTEAIINSPLVNLILSGVREFNLKSYGLTVGLNGVEKDAGLVLNYEEQVSLIEKLIKALEGNYSSEDGFDYNDGKVYLYVRNLHTNLVEMDLKIIDLPGIPK